MLERVKSSFLFIFLLAPVLIGCDQIQNFFHPASLTKPSSTSATEGGAPVVQGTVLARVNNDVITLESFEEKIKAAEAMSPETKLTTFDQKKGFLDGLVTQALIVQEAKARGIDKKKEIKDAIEEFSKGIMARQLVLDETKGLVVDPSEIETFYNQYKGRFASEVEVRAREIAVPSEQTAKDILIALLQGGDFATIAKERSIAATASKGGDAGVIKRGDKFDKYYEVLVTLEPGQSSQIFKGPDGNFYIVKAEEKKGGSVPRLDEVYDKIKNGLLQQKQTQRIQDLADKLKRDAKIEVKEDLLR
jgi:parvulin-like peptidyl-prolyl isomerase